MDLAAKLNFKPESAEQLDYLIYSLCKTSVFPTFEEEEMGIQVNPTSELVDLGGDLEKRKLLCDKLYNNLNTDTDYLSYKQIVDRFKPLSQELNVNFRFDTYEQELNRLINVFLESSYATCFSETNSDFLMWSHYASKHTGVCLEFTLKNEGLFPYIRTSERENDDEKYVKRMSEWQRKSHIYWDRIRKITYQEDLPMLSFYDFTPVFENEGDCDLMGLSKSRWHGYAYELENIFSHKTVDWKYEKEWRAIDINFNGYKQPEERIHHYPSEALTKVYFGIRTPNYAKERIYQIIYNKNPKTEFYVAKLTDNRELGFEYWFGDEDA